MTDLIPEDRALIEKHMTGYRHDGGMWVCDAHLAALIHAARDEGRRSPGGEIGHKALSSNGLSAVEGSKEIGLREAVARLIMKAGDRAGWWNVAQETADAILALPGRDEAALPEPAGWGLFNPDTKRFRNALCPTQEAAESIASRRSDNYLMLEARPLYAAPQPSTELPADVVP